MQSMRNTAPIVIEAAPRAILSLREPTHARPLPGGEPALVRVLSGPLLGGVRGGFMVPMGAPKRKKALHEPRAKAGASSTHSKRCRAVAERLGFREAFGVR